MTDPGAEAGREKALREREEKYRNLFENAAVAMYRSRLDGSGIVAANRKLAELFDCTVDDLTGNPATVRWADPAKRVEMTEALKKNGGHLENFEIDILTVKGTRKTTLASIRLYPAEGYLEGSAVDITEWKRAQAGLARNEALFRSLVETMNDGLAMQDTNGIITYANPRLVEMLGYSREEITGRPWKSLFDPEGLKVLTEQMAKRQAGQRSSYSVPWRTKDGRTLHTLISGNPILDQAGKLKGSFGVITDITDRHGAEDALRHSEQKFSTAFQIAPYAITITHAEDGKFVDVNDAFTAISGFTKEEALADSSIGLKLWVNEKDRQSVVAALRAGRTVVGHEYQFNVKNGKVITGVFSAQMVHLSQGICILSSINDITERKRTEDALHRKSLILEQSIASVSTADINGIIDYVNPAFVKLWGYESREKAIGQSVGSFFAKPEDAVPVLEAIGKNGFWEGEFLGRKQDGKEFISRGFASKVLDAQGNHVGYQSTNLDVTDRNNAVEEIRLNAERTETLLKLNQMSGATLKEITDFTIEEAVRLTKSTMGYLAFLNEDETVLTMHSWSKSAMAECAIVDKPIIYPVATTGLWGDAVRQRRAVITNDYAAPVPGKKGYPKGHVAVLRHMNIPVFSGKRIVLVAGVGNKTEPYDGSDAKQLTLLMDGMWNVLERKRTEDALREAKENYQSMIANLSIGFYNVSLDGILLNHNRAFSGIIGYGPKENLVGYRMPDFWQDPADRQEYIRELFKTGEIRNFLANAKKKCGERIIAELNAHIVKDLQGKSVRIEGTVTDVTEKKRTEEELRRHRENLEELVRARTRELEAANRELEAFSYSVSHDLRAPLRTIDGFSLAVMEDCAGKLDITSRENLGRVRAATQRMGQLIDDLLKLSRVSRSEMKREKVNLTSLARSVADELQKTEPERRVDFAIAEDLTAGGDAKLLRVVMENLLSNAWKFTGRHTQSRIEIGALQENEETVFYVRDDGAGFDMAYADKLFTPFQRLHTVTEFPGTGIGLATIQRIVARHGGRVWAKGAVERGATFYFTIPDIGKGMEMI